MVIFFIAVVSLWTDIIFKYQFKISLDYVNSYTRILTKSICGVVQKEQIHTKLNWLQSKYMGTLIIFWELALAFNLLEICIYLITFYCPYLLSVYTIVIDNSERKYFSIA